jgi:hypothetical protein
MVNCSFHIARRAGLWSLMCCALAVVVGLSGGCDSRGTGGAKVAAPNSASATTEITIALWRIQGPFDILPDRVTTAQGCRYTDEQIVATANAAINDLNGGGSGGEGLYGPGIRFKLHKDSNGQVIVRRLTDYRLTANGGSEIDRTRDWRGIFDVINGSLTSGLSYPTNLTDWPRERVNIFFTGRYSDSWPDDRSDPPPVAGAATTRPFGDVQAQQTFPASQGFIYVNDSETDRTGEPEWNGPRFWPDGTTPVPQFRRYIAHEMTHYFALINEDHVRYTVGMQTPPVELERSDASYYGLADPSHDINLTGPTVTDRRYLRNILKPGNHVASLRAMVSNTDFQKFPLFVPGAIVSSSVPADWDGIQMTVGGREKEHIWRRIKSGRGFVP